MNRLDKNMTYAELCNAMYEFNDKLKKENMERSAKGESGVERKLVGVIVFKESSFDKEYPLESRSYRVSNNNKAWIAGMGGYSIYGSALDGSDPCVRLERYMRAEKGGENGWEVDYCYLLEEGE